LFFKSNRLRHRHVHCFLFLCRVRIKFSLCHGSRVFSRRDAVPDNFSVFSSPSTTNVVTNCISSWLLPFLQIKSPSPLPCPLLSLSFHGLHWVLAVSWVSCFLPSWSCQPSGFLSLVNPLWQTSSQTAFPFGFSLFFKLNRLLHHHVHCFFSLFMLRIKFLLCNGSRVFSRREAVPDNFFRL
jgi:hypothetical protein